MEELLIQDPEIAASIAAEADRQVSKLELIASENFVSTAVRQAQGSIMTHKYAEGYPHKRYYGGCEFVDIAEDIARDRAKALFDCDYVNVQPHSGSQANMAVYFGYCQPGDTILTMELSHGGHLTHGSPVNFSGKLFNVVHYGVTREDQTIDYEQVEALAKEHKPAMIVAGASATPASSTLPASGPSPMKWAPSSWWTWRTSRASLQRANTPAASRTPTSPPPRPTRPCEARAAA